MMNIFYQVILNHEYVNIRILIFIYNFQAFVLILYIQHMYITFYELHLILYLIYIFIYIL